MREIKFRAFYKPFDIMSKPFVSVYSPQQGDYVSLEQMLTSESERWVVMQYTGLKDKNGVEIYEGDIVKAHNILHGREYELKHLDCSYALYIDEVMYGWLCSSLVEQLEVIGNIYQNPELLK